MICEIITKRERKMLTKLRNHEIMSYVREN